LARALVRDGHEVVLVARGNHVSDPAASGLLRIRFHRSDLSDPKKLAAAFAGCDAVAHCAGINRQIGFQTYQRVHVEGTRNVVRAAQWAGARRLALLSFLRARPRCGSAYHESKWAAEEIVRASALDYTILKAGVIYGKGDHMLNHLSHAFHTFPAFGLVGFKEPRIRPMAVADVVRILRAALVDGRLPRQTLAVFGPEEMTLSEAVRRVARVANKRPLILRLPLWFHYALAWVLERLMVVPLVSIAQVRILSEGIVEPVPPCDLPPDDLKPRLPFDAERIRAGLPEAKAFGLADCRCCAGARARRPRRRRWPFFEFP
jgi:NADH dehydrogenase